VVSKYEKTGYDKDKDAREQIRCLP